MLLGPRSRVSRRLHPPHRGQTAVGCTCDRTSFVLPSRGPRGRRPSPCGGLGTRPRPRCSSVLLLCVPPMGEAIIPLSLAQSFLSGRRCEAEIQVRPWRRLRHRAGNTVVYPASITINFAQVRLWETRRIVRRKPDRSPGSLAKQKWYSSHVEVISRAINFIIPGSLRRPDAST